MRDALPISRRCLSREFMELDESELRTTALDIIAQKGGVV
jgi:hypothetical protein